MSRILLNSTRAAQRAGLSAKAFNHLLYSKKILNHRARPSKKDPKVMKPFWELLDLQYGQNFNNVHGGLTFKLYEDKLEYLFADVGLGGVL